MKGIIFTGDRHCAVVERERQEPGWGEVRVRIRASGICGSDLSVYRAPFLSDQIRGHEPSGEVDVVGPGVVHLRPGDRVSVHHHIGCGHCPACARGETVACPEDKVIGVAVTGSFGEYVVAPERNCIPLPDGVSTIDGAFMACVGATGYAALRRLEVRPHESLAVFGLGPVGLATVLVAKAMGLRVAGVDIQPHRLELARACGADEAVNSAETDAAAALQAFGRVTGDERRKQPGVDHLVETSGSAPARRAMLPSIRRGGRIAIVGVGSDEDVINPTHIHGKAATIIGSVVFPLEWSWDLARFLALTGLHFEPAVTHRFGLDDAVDALRVADRAEGGKVVFVS